MLLVFVQVLVAHKYFISLHSLNKYNDKEDMEGRQGKGRGIICSSFVMKVAVVFLLISLSWSFAAAHGSAVVDVGHLVVQLRTVVTLSLCQTLRVD